MKRSAVRIALGAALVCIVAGNAQSPAPKKTTTPSPRPKETFWQWAARFSGISANPNTLKGADDELRSGQVWVADLSTGASRKITADDGYRSPVYFPNGSDILALQGVSVVRLSSSGQRPVEVFRVAGISKLVGFSLDDADEVLALEEDDAGHVSAGRLSLRSGVITPLPYDPRSSRDHQMLEHLQDWQRSYGETTVYVKRESKQALSGPVEVFNVFVKAKGRDPQEVSRCDLSNCGQPSLAPDGKRVLFIKAAL